jgi:predicted acetyltransferase
MVMRAIELTDLVPTLVLPTVDLEASWREAAAEPHATQRDGFHTEVADFGEYIEYLRADVHEDTARPDGWVPCSRWWWVEGETYLARISVRHRLTPSLLEEGGHIGYDVRPSARRQGHATAMLRATLPHVHSLGIPRALLTCDYDNVGSRKVIEANGGVLEDRRGVKLRYWVPTS